MTKNIFNDKIIKKLNTQYDLQVRSGFLILIKAIDLHPYILDCLMGAYTGRNEMFKKANHKHCFKWEQMVSGNVDKEILDLLRAIYENHGTTKTDHQVLYDLLVQLNYTRAFMLNVFARYWIHVVHPVIRKFSTVFDRFNFTPDREHVYLSAYAQRIISNENTTEPMTRASMIELFKSFWKQATDPIRVGRDTIDQIIMANKEFIMDKVRKFRNNCQLDEDDLFQETFIHLRNTYNQYDDKKCSLLGYWDVSIRRFLINLTSKKSNLQEMGTNQSCDESTDPDQVLNSLLQLEDMSLVEQLFANMEGEDVQMLSMVFGINGHNRQSIKGIADLIGRPANNVRRYDIPRAMKNARKALFSLLQSNA